MTVKLTRSALQFVRKQRKLTDKNVFSIQETDWLVPVIFNNWRYLIIRVQKTWKVNIDYFNRFLLKKKRSLVEIESWNRSKVTSCLSGAENVKGDRGFKEQNSAFLISILNSSTFENRRTAEVLNAIIKKDFPNCTLFMKEAPLILVLLINAQCSTTNMNSKQRNKIWKQVDKIISVTFDCAIKGTGANVWSLSGSLATIEWSQVRLFC